MAKKNFINKTHIEGLLYQHSLELKVSGPNSKTPGTQFIAGNIEIATDDAGLNIVPIHFSYVTAVTSSGKTNATFGTLMNIIDEKFPSVMKSGKENAAKLVPISETSSRYYLRFTTKDSFGVLASITGIFSQNEISIESIIQKDVKDPGKVSIVVISECTKESKMLTALEAIDSLSSVSEKSQMIRFLK